MDLDTQDILVGLMIEFLDAAFGEFIDRSEHSVSGHRENRRVRRGSGRCMTLWPGCGLAAVISGTSLLATRGGQAGGSIVELLKALKPMLPKAFFPGILHYSFLRKVQKSLPAIRDVRGYSE